MLAKILHKYATGVILAVLGLSLYLGSLLPDLKITLDFSNYLPRESKELDFYRDYLDVFGSRDDLLSIGLYRSEGIYDSVFLQKADALTDSCKSLPLVSRVTSLTRMSLPRKTIIGVVPQRLIHQNDSETLASDSTRLSKYEILQDRFFSRDGTTLVLTLELKPERSIEDSKRLIHNLDQLISSFEFEEVHIAGTTDLEVRYAWESERELKRFLVLCLLLIILVLGFIYRSISVVLLSLGVFILSLIFLGGFLVLAGQELDAMAPMIPSIILIVSISDVIHILASYSRSGENFAARVVAINEVIKTNFLTSLTTAIGFFTLMLSPIPMLYYFGMYVGAGVLIAYVVSILMVPAILFLSHSSSKEPKGIFSIDRWEWVASKLEKVERRSPRTIFGVCAALLLISCWGISLIDSNRTIASPMPKNNPMVKAFHFFEEHLAGAREFELAVYAKEKGDLANLENLQQIEKIHRYLDSLPEVGGLISPASYYQWLNSFNHQMRPDKLLLPENEEELEWQELTAPWAIERQFRSVIDSSRTYGAIRGRMPDMGTHRARELLAKIDQWMAGHVDTSSLILHHTGTPIILDLVNDIQIKAMFKGLGIAIICISLIMSFLFFDLRMIAITLLINLVPLVIVAGMMGFLGIELRGGTSIVFSIAFVLAVDDTIHFFNNVFFKKKQGMDPETAIAITLRQTGQPILITSLVIFLAFALIATSHLGNVQYLGILVSLTAVFALISDLLLAPLLLRLFLRSR